MPLFNKKTIDRHLAVTPKNGVGGFASLREWADAIKSGRIASLAETELHAQFQQKIVIEALGYRGPIGNSEYTVTAEKNILKGSVDLAFGNFGSGKSEIIAPFELKGAKTRDLDAIMPGRAKSPVDQAWEYANNNSGSKWVLVSNYLEVRLYSYAEGRQAYERFDLASADSAEYHRLLLLVSAENLLGGRTSEILEDSKRENKDITDRLYGDYKVLRQSLIDAVRKSNTTLDPLVAIRLGQTILDRILFIAFAEDTGLLPRETLPKAYLHNDPYNPRPIWQNFLGLFRSIDEGSETLGIPRYNGGLFKSDEEISKLEIPNELCEGFKQLAEYDFASEVSVTVLGHIFEQSITDVEQLQARARGLPTQEKKSAGTSGRRKRDGVVYTPDYIARFIVEKSIGTHLSEIFDELLRRFATKGASASDDPIRWKSAAAEREAWSSYREAISKLRIVDPACGSGVFLVMAFDYLKAEIVKVNGKIAELTGKGMAGDLLDPDSQILTDNLFGVDVNEESIEIAKLSLWIKTARRGKVLDSLDKNFRVGDSLVEDSSYAYRAHGFVWKEAFADVFAHGRFDIVLGNPPYVRMEYLKAMKPYLQKRFEVVSDRADLYAYFFERGMKLLKPGGRLGFISSATFFKTGAGEPLRQYLRLNATIETVVNFGDLQIFDGVTTYPAILTMKNAVPPDDSKLQFLNLDALPTDGLSSAFEEHSAPYPQAALTNGSWALEDDTRRTLRDKIRKGRRTLLEVYGSPYAGIKTGFNEAFILDEAERDAIIKSDARSDALIKPIVFGNEVHKWHIERKNLWIIYIPKNKVDIEKYPAIKAWLLRHKERLNKRAADQKWFELQQAQERFSGVYAETKLIYRDIADTPTFSVDTGSYPDMTCFCLKGASYFEAALLNSKLMWFTLTSTTTIASGGFFRMKTQYVEPLPIPDASKSEREALADLAKSCQEKAEKRYGIIQSVSRRFVDLCPKGKDAKLSERLKDWWLLPDFKAFQAEIKKALKAEIPLAQRTEWETWLKSEKAKVTSIDREIAVIEQDIDKKVYGLFKMNNDDISLIESSLGEIAKS